MANSGGLDSVNTDVLGNQDRKSTRETPPPTRSKKVEARVGNGFLARGRPGFARYGESRMVETEPVGAFCRDAIGGRFVKKKTPIEAAGFLRPIVLFSVAKRSRFFGGESLFAMWDARLSCEGGRRRRLTWKDGAEWMRRYRDHGIAITTPGCCGLLFQGPSGFIPPGETGRSLRYAVYR